MRSRSIVAASLVLLASTAGAQQRPEREVLNSARDALKQLRAAIADGDTAAIRRSVEAPSSWSVLRNVTDTDRTGYSFWQPGSRVDVDKLDLRIQSDGSVLAMGLIDVRGHRGDWVAVLDNVNGRWKFREHSESWGGNRTRFGQN